MRLIEAFTCTSGICLDREDGTQLDHARYQNGKMALTGTFDLEDLEAMVEYMRAKNEVASA